MHWEAKNLISDLIWSDLILETDQNETSLWIKQEQIFACGFKFFKLNLKIKHIFIYLIIGYLFFFKFPYSSFAFL